jgi:hypothetical protein
MMMGERPTRKEMIEMLDHLHAKAYDGSWSALEAERCRFFYSVLVMEIKRLKPARGRNVP